MDTPLVGVKAQVSFVRLVANFTDPGASLTTVIQVHQSHMPFGIVLPWHLLLA